MPKKPITIKEESPIMPLDTPDEEPTKEEELKKPFIRRPIKLLTGWPTRPE